MRAGSLVEKYPDKKECRYPDREKCMCHMTRSRFTGKPTVSVTDGWKNDNSPKRNRPDKSCLRLNATINGNISRQAAIFFIIVDSFNLLTLDGHVIPEFSI